MKSHVSSDKNSVRVGDTVTAKDLPVLGRKVLSHNEFFEVTHDTVGKVLTLLDASIVDKGQLTALKQVVKQAIWDNFKRAQDWYVGDKIDLEWPFRHFDSPVVQLPKKDLLPEDAF